MPKRIFILTGEPSGDYYGALLTRKLYELDPNLAIEGAGGMQMRNAGAKIIRETAHLGVIGILNAVLKIVPIFKALFFVLKYLRKNPPDLLILIDFGAFNMYILRKLKKKIPAMYYIPPGCWSRYRKPGELPHLVSAIATPFSWSAENLKKTDADVEIEWVGHPLLDSIATTKTKEEARKELGIGEDEKVLAIIPGSRPQELKYMLPMYFSAAKSLTGDAKLLVSVAKNVKQAEIRRYIPKKISEENIIFVDGLDRDILQIADAAFVTSGTATLEMALLQIPMVVSYRGSNIAGLQYQYWKNKRGFEWISLPNIILEESVIPEYVQYAANADVLTGAMNDLLFNIDSKDKQKSAFTKLRASLGENGSIDRVADMAFRRFLA